MINLANSPLMSKSDFYVKNEVDNDVVNIYDKPDVKISRIRRPEPLFPDYYDEAKLHVLIQGSSIDVSIVNALRRTVMCQIPVYGFHRSNIKIVSEKSRYMYNNDMIYGQIECLPIPFIDNDFDLENPEIYLPNEIMKSIFGSFLPKKYISTEQEDAPEQEIVDPHRDTQKKILNIDISLAYKNTTGRAVYITSHELELKIDDRISDNFRRRERVCLFVLKPGEESVFSARANLGISKMNAAYDAVTNAVHIQLSPSSFELYYSTLHQLTQDKIFTKACQILTAKLRNLYSFIKYEYPEREDITQIIEINLYGEDHTLGNLLATVLKKCPAVKAAAYAMPHPSQDHIVVRYQLDDNTKMKTAPIRILLDCINYLVLVFETIQQRHQDLIAPKTEKS